MNRNPLATLVLAAACALLPFTLPCLPLLAGEAKPAPQAKPQLPKHLIDAMTNPVDDPKLPRVLIIGDSISIGYTVPVRKQLQGKANVHRPGGNCMFSAHHVANLEKWLGKEKWDVIHFNCGIWDTHMLDKKTGALVYNESKVAADQMRVRTAPEQYRANLANIVKVLKGTGAKVIWASTTPVTNRQGDRAKTIDQYNEIAAAVMKENGIVIDDLGALVTPRLAQWQANDKCHFNQVGYDKLGEQVSKCILDALPARETPAKAETPPAR
jgi:acyl-CoA thioesterase-1